MKMATTVQILFMILNVLITGAEVSIYTPGPAGKIKGLQKHSPTQAKWGPTSHLHVKNVIGKE